MDYFDTIPKYPKTDNFKMLGIILTYRTNFKNQKCSLPFSFPYSLYYFIIFFFFFKDYQDCSIWMVTIWANGGLRLGLL